MSVENKTTHTPDNVADSYRNKFAEKIITTELLDIDKWYKERLKELGEMTVEEADLTDGQNWKATITETNQVEKVDGAFFTLKGEKITRHDKEGNIIFQWTQPELKQKEQEILLPTPDGIQAVKASGLVGIIMDQDNNILLTLAQEPFAQTPKNALIRTPFQTSATKFKGLLEGKKELDPGLFDVINEIGGGQNINDMLKKGTVDTFPLPYADANRITATNIGFVMRVTDPNLRKRLKKNGENKWFSERAINYTVKAGLLNGHTAAAIIGARAK